MEFKKYPTTKQLMKEISKKVLHSCYFFIGEEEGEKDKLIHLLANSIFGDDTLRTYSTGNFHMELDELGDAAEFALSKSMFSDKKICVMRNIDALGSTKQNIDLLYETLDNLPDSHMLIMTSKKNRIPAFIDLKRFTAIRVYHFWRMFENDCISYIGDQLKRGGFHIDPSAAAFLFGLTGRDMQRIDEAVKQIIDFKPEGTVTSDLVREIITDQRESSLNELIVAVLKRDRKALEILKKLLENNYHELVILTALVKQVEQIERFYILLEKGSNRDEAVAGSGVPQRKKGEFMDFVRSNPPERVKCILNVFHRTDYGIKTYRPSRGLASNPLFEAVEALVV